MMKFKNFKFINNSLDQAEYTGFIVRFLFFALKIFFHNSLKRTFIDPIKEQVAQGTENLFHRLATMLIF